jgi:enoyl-[acyl-carrier protein] reductase/trans-2-enoyl-CoA reductase (NAD+)
MIVEPKIRNNICLTAHPTGCFVQVQRQIDFVRRKGAMDGPKRVLIIGSSNGYGLASRIVAAFGCGADTVGISYERPGSETRPGTAGWYNENALVEKAEESGLKALTVNGDAFSNEMKQKVCELIAVQMQAVDLVVYSIASPRRIDPESGDVYASVIKPIGKSYTAKTLDFQTGVVSTITAEPATKEEIGHTIKVMGGEDWELWIAALLRKGVLADRVKTVAYSYLGPDLTYPIYREGTIGRAKKHLEDTAGTINKKLKKLGGMALVSVNKALVTRASAVIPAVPLYISLLYRVMKSKGIHEGCIQQMHRLFRDYLCTENPKPPDSYGRLRLDDLEMREDVQREVSLLWKQASTENLARISDIKGFREEFLMHHGFGMSGVDYDADVSLE